MVIVAVLFSDAVPFEQIISAPLPEGPMSNLVKIGRMVSEKKTFKDHTISYTYIRCSTGERADEHGWHNYTYIEIWFPLLLHAGGSGPRLWWLRPKDFLISRLVPGTLALVGPTEVQLLLFCFASAFKLFLAGES